MKISSVDSRKRTARLRTGFGVFVAIVVAAAFSASPTGAQVPPAAIAVDPTAGPAGTVVTVTGTGFEGTCSVAISLGPLSAGMVLGFTDADADGNISVEVTIPAGAPVGLTTIVATGNVLTGTEFPSCLPSTRVAAADFEVTPGSGGLVPRFVPPKPAHTEITEGFSTSEIHLKFVQGSMVRLRSGEFVTLGSDDLTGLQGVLAAFPGVVPSRLFSARTEDELAREKARLEAKSGREMGDKNLYFLLTYPGTVDGEALIDALNALAIVELAYPVPGEGEDPSHADYRPNQGYREAAPTGVAADAAMTVAGGRGSNVQVIDVERFFNETHEDLPTVTTFDNGDVDAEFDPPYDHGTAVLGEVFGEDNGFGVLGIADQADPGFVTTAGGRPNAIDIATANSVGGDVILLELQRSGPNGVCSNANGQFGCVPEEFVQASYDAIVAAVADGIIVVAAAGNGQQDLDGDEYDDTFGTRPDSGAIIVGAGASGAPGCTTPARERLGFSNFGSRVNLQGWGECVATTGYGTLEGDPDTNDAYTGGFSGTSSATPIVAAAAAVVSSVAEENGESLDSVEVRQLLIDTGTPQDTTNDDGHIGPLPNLADALGMEADLIVSKTDDPDPVAAGEEITYTITVTNEGPNVAIDVTLSDDLPDEVTFVSTTGSCVLLISPELVCDLGDIGVGDSVEIEVVVDVPPDLVFDAGGPVLISNTASATSTIDDPDEANSSDSENTLVVAVADLSVDDVEILGVPDEALIGDDIDIVVRSTVQNHGPSWPLDALLETTGTPSAGASVSPASDTAEVDALLLNTPRVVDQEFTISCTAPGEQKVVFDVEISPANAADTDPNPANNTGQVTATVECVVPIVINIHPGNKFNKVNLISNGVIHAAALTTEAGEYGLPIAFDATLIVPESVRFGDADAVWAETGGAAFFNGLFHIQDWHELDDKTKDGDLDMRLHFKIPETGIVSGATEACMKGEYVDGGMTFKFFGCDFVETKK